MKLPEGATRTFKQSLAGSVRMVWNEVIKDFLSTDAEWIFSTHHDVQFVPETLMRLLSWDKTIINALVFMRQNPVIPQVWKSYDPNNEGLYVMRVNDTREWFYRHPEYIRFGPFVMDERPDNALVPVGFTATACTLIHRKVFEDIEKMNKHQFWFVCDNELTGGGEDRRFYEYARAAGHTGYIDRSCIAGHIAGDICTSSADFIGWDSVSSFIETGEPEPKNKTQFLINLENVIKSKHG